MCKETMGLTTCAKPTMLRFGVIIFAFLSGGTWTIHCTQAQNLYLPTELQDEMTKIQNHFCQNNTGSCSGMPPRSLCCPNNNNNKCYNGMDSGMCMGDDQDQHCVYVDAIVCRYSDGRGSCIYFNSSSTQPLCVCKDDNGTWPTSDAQESLIRVNCSINDSSTSDGTESNPSLQTNMPMSTHTAASIGTVTSMPTSSQTMAVISSHQPTILDGLSSAAAAPLDGGIDQGNTVSIVLGVILSLVLLVLILVLFLRWRGKLPSQKKKASQPRDPSSVELDEQTSDRAQLPQPLVVGSSEYSYAYDHRPQRSLTPDTGKPKPVNHTVSNRYEPDGSGCSSSSATGNSTESHQDHSYYEIGRSQDGETLQNRKYYELGGAQNMEKGNSGETPPDPQYFVLERTRDGGTIEADLPPGGQSKQGDDPAYFTLMPTTESQTPGYEALQPRTSGYEALQTRNPRYEALQVASSSEGNDASFPGYEALQTRTAGYEPLQTLTSGYEPLQVETSSEGNDASSPGYQALQPRTSGYEAPHVATSSEGNDASSPYDHLDNTIGNRSKKGGVPKNESDNHHYASLNG